MRESPGFHDGVNFGCHGRTLTVARENQHFIKKENIEDTFSKKFQNNACKFFMQIIVDLGLEIQKFMELWVFW